MTTEEALKWADTWGPIPSDPPDGDAPALLALAAEVRRLRELTPGDCRRCPNFVVLADEVARLRAFTPATVRESIQRYRLCTGNDAQAVSFVLDWLDDQEAHHG